MYVQLYITVGLKEIPKGNGEAGAYHFGAWASADSRRGWGSRPRDHDPSKERKYGPARIRCFQKRKKIGCRRSFAGICPGARAY